MLRVKRIPRVVGGKLKTGKRSGVRGESHRTAPMGGGGKEEGVRGRIGDRGDRGFARVVPAPPDQAGA